MDRHPEEVIARTRAAVAALAELGVVAVVTGSLARRTFDAHSDVDLLITACPRALKYAIEHIVEDKLGGLPFDVTYLDELPEWKVAGFTQGAVDASELG
jgi:predicted nucleotidyltransferase